jgi:hypothetical protein
MRSKLFTYFGFGLKLRLIALQAQRNDSGFMRGVTSATIHTFRRKSMSEVF